MPENLRDTAAESPITPHPQVEAAATDGRSAAESASAGAVDQPPLQALIADLVLGVPAVVRLEPTLSSAGPALLLGGTTDGVRVLTRGGATDVEVSVVTSAVRPARAITHDIRSGIFRLLEDQHLRGGLVTVSVLGIDPPSDRPAQ